jgi:hypothetical protein
MSAGRQPGERGGQLAGDHGPAISGSLILASPTAAVSGLPTAQPTAVRRQVNTPPAAWTSVRRLANGKAEVELPRLHLKHD